MKIKVIASLIIVSAIGLSFSFVSIDSTKRIEKKTSVSNNEDEPVGGFVMEDKL